MPEEPQLIPFAYDRQLINSKFEGYKLHLFPDDTNVQRQILPQPGAKVPQIPTSANLSFRALQARVQFNHLFTGHDDGCAFYIDADSSVVMVEVDLISKSVQFHKLLQLPILDEQLPSYVDPDSSLPYHREYPSIKSLTHDHILVSNGMGSIYLVKIFMNDTMAKLGRIVLTTEYFGDGSEGIEPVGCILCDAKYFHSSTKEPEILLIVQSTTSMNSKSMATSTKAISKTLFNVALLRLPLTQNFHDIPSNQEVQAKVLHMLRGIDYPFYCAIDPSGEGYVIGSQAEYEVVFINQSPAENMDIDTQQQLNTTSNIGSHISPYYWVQTTSDLTISFNLPPGTLKADVNALFTPDHLSLIVNSLNRNDINAEPVISYPYRKLFGSIDPAASTWTIEPTGFLTLSLKKFGEEHWNHVFEQNDGILESNESAEIRARFQKIVLDGENKHPGLGQPGLEEKQHDVQFGSEIEDEIDLEGHPIIFSWVDRESKIGAKTTGGSYDWLCRSFDPPALSNLPAVALKRDVDALVFTIGHSPMSDNSSTKAPLTLTHIATFNALAFVQASKREKRFMYFDPSFTFAMIVEAARNAYIYWRSGQKHQMIEKQSLVDVTEGQPVDVIGVQLIAEKTIALLTDQKLVLIRVALD